jgi:PKD repeat protein
MKRLRAWIILAGFVTFYTVTAKAQCTADFVVTSKQCEGSPITFKASDTGTTVKFLWNFGDVFSGSDNIDSVANPSHLFTGNGIYKVSLIVYDTNGCRDTFIYSLRIYAKPKADFSFSNACSGLPTTFINASLADSGDIINQWLWNFGNGITSQSKDTVLQYSSTGTKQISLIIQSSQGCRDTILKNVSIYKKPTAQSDLKSACKLGQINFTADTIGQAISYLWDFGDSSFFSTRTANHVYKKTGYIYPVLTVSFATTKCILNIDSILIRNLPDASFSLNNDTQCFTNNKVCVKPNVKPPG